MVNYDLAKKLKDSGFPQVGDSRFCFVEGNPMVLCFGIEYWSNGDEVSRKMLMPPNALYVPTLSELIEACGESLDFIKRGDKDLLSSLLDKEEIATDWVAGTKDLKLLKFGQTPEEAVANLWLALNK